MQDRIPLYPGRVTMTPVAGQANTFDMVRADDPTQAGTPLNKATLLKDATAALYGLGTVAVPDDVLAWIGAYNTYWWRRKKTGESTWEYLHSTNRNAYPDSGEVPISSTWVEHRENNSDTLLDYNNTYSYAAEITIDQSTGVISLVAPNTTTATDGDEERNFIRSKAPCYLTTSYRPSKIYYVPDGATSGTSYTNTLYGNGFPVGFGSAGNPHGMVVTAVQKTINYEYEYLGIPFDNAVTAPRIETGRYVGTGTYGDTNKNSLTLPFSPVLLLISDGKRGFAVIPMAGENGVAYFGTTQATWKVTRDGNTISWYMSDGKHSDGSTWSYSAEGQMNTSNTTYYYFAIG